MLVVRMHVLLTLLLCQMVSGTLLVDYNADRGDDPSNIGLLNLESTRDVRVSQNTPDLYIKSGLDWKGTNCAHIHRKKDFIRAEYHALNKRTEAGKTYYIGYEFALGAVPDALMIWQWKEYEANANGGGANIPLSLEIRDGKLQFEYSSGPSASRAPQWTKAIKTNSVHTIGIEILAKSSGGHVRLWWDGNPATFTTTGTTILEGNTFPGRSDPKFGAYRGESVEVDTYIYQVQMGNNKAELDSKFFQSVGWSGDTEPRNGHSQTPGSTNMKQSLGLTQQNRT